MARPRVSPSHVEKARRNDGSSPKRDANEVTLYSVVRRKSCTRRSRNFFPLAAHLQDSAPANGIFLDSNASRVFY